MSAPKWPQLESLHLTNLPVKVSLEYQLRHCSYRYHPRSSFFAKFYDLSSWPQSSLLQPASMKSDLSNIQMAKGYCPLSSSVNFILQKNVPCCASAGEQVLVHRSCMGQGLGFLSRPQPSVLAPAKPDSCAYAPSAPVLYGILDSKLLKRGICYILESMQCVTRSKTSRPIPWYDLSKVGMHHPPVDPM